MMDMDLKSHLFQFSVFFAISTGRCYFFSRSFVTSIPLLFQRAVPLVPLFGCISLTTCRATITARVLYGWWLHFQVVAVINKHTAERRVDQPVEVRLQYENKMTNQSFQEKSGLSFAMRLAKGT